jgi:hypothetical protein
MSRTAGDNAVVTPIATSFVIGQLESGRALLATTNHNISEDALADGTNLVILLPRRDARPGDNALQGLIVSGVSFAESSSDVVLIVADIDESVVMPSLIPLSLEIPRGVT